MKRTPFHQTAPFRVPTDDGKTIEEHFGAVATESRDVSIAHMIAPPGWSEPAQTPEFGEYTLMVSGTKRIELPDGAVTLKAGESLFVPAGTRVRYSNPFDQPSHYCSVCIPAFSPETVNREED